MSLSHKNDISPEFFFESQKVLSYKKHSFKSKSNLSKNTLKMGKYEISISANRQILEKPIPQISENGKVCVKVEKKYKKLANL